MHSKLQFDSKWRLGEGLITQLVSKWELNYTISGTVGVEIIPLLPGYPWFLSSNSEQVSKNFFRG